MRTEHQQRVYDFMKLAGQDLPEVPALPSKDTRELRARLILEEALETVEALGFKASATMGFSVVSSKDFILLDGPEPDLVEIADGCADISVIATGTLIACGIEDAELLAEVDKNNLAKFGEGGYRREDGKWMKPPGHKSPDITAVLKSQGME
jgi:predicted HAD superfamily Cof-like phosphohydrolase